MASLTPSVAVNTQSDAQGRGAPLHVALACDEHYVAQLVVTATSIARHAKRCDELWFHVIFSGLDEPARLRVEACVRYFRPGAQFAWIAAPQEIESIFGVVLSKQHAHLTPATLYRLLLDDLLDHSVNQIVYVDIDTVVRADLGALLAALPDDMPLAGVRDFVYPSLVERFPLAEQRHKLCITDSGPYLNAGVLAINRPRWRGQRLGSAALDQLVRSPEIMLSKDQDALNAALNGRGAVVDARWNVQLGMLGRGKPHLTRKVMGVADGLTERRLIEEAHVLHFTGPKPWIRGINAPARAIWWRALHDSGWLSELAFRGSQARWWGKQLMRHLPRLVPCNGKAAST